MATTKLLEIDLILTLLSRKFHRRLLWDCKPMMKIVSKLGKWSVTSQGSISRSSTRNWTLLSKSLERASIIHSSQKLLRNSKLEDWSNKIPLQLRRESRRRMKRRKKRSLRKKRIMKATILKNFLIPKDAKLSVFLLKSIPFLWLLSNLMEDTTMIAQILRPSTTGSMFSKLIELSTLLTQDKESILRWSLLQPKKSDGWLPKDVSIWALVSFLVKMVKNSKREQENQSDFWICSTKPKRMLWSNWRAERKVRSNKAKKVKKNKENKFSLP